MWWIGFQADLPDANLSATCDPPGLPPFAGVVVGSSSTGGSAEQILTCTDGAWAPTALSGDRSIDTWGASQDGTSIQASQTVWQSLGPTGWVPTWRDHSFAVEVSGVRPPNTLQVLSYSCEATLQEEWTGTDWGRASGVRDELGDALNLGGAAYTCGDRRTVLDGGLTQSTHTITWVETNGANGALAKTEYGDDRRTRQDARRTKRDRFVEVQEYFPDGRLEVESISVNDDCQTPTGRTCWGEPAEGYARTVMHSDLGEGRTSPRAVVIDHVTAGVFATDKHRMILFRGPQGELLTPFGRRSQQGGPITACSFDQATAELESFQDVEDRLGLGLDLDSLPPSPEA